MTLVSLSLDSGWLGVCNPGHLNQGYEQEVHRHAWMFSSIPGTTLAEELTDQCAVNFSPSDKE